MKIYCLRCKQKTDTVNLVETKTLNNKKMMKGQCKTCKTNKCSFLGMKTVKRR